MRSFCWLFFLELFIGLGFVNIRLFAFEYCFFYDFISDLINFSAIVYFYHRVHWDLERQLPLKVYLIIK